MLHLAQSVGVPGKTIHCTADAAQRAKTRHGGVTQNPVSRKLKQQAETPKQNIYAAPFLPAVACTAVHSSASWLQAGDYGSVHLARAMFRSLFAPRNAGSTTPAAAGDAASPKEKDGAASNRAEVVASPKTQRKDQAIASHIQKMDTKIRYVWLR